MPDPDYIYDPSNWEITFRWSERDQLAEDFEVGFCGIGRFKTLIQGPDRFCVLVNNKYCWFDTMAEAEAAWQADVTPHSQPYSD